MPSKNSDPFGLSHLNAPLKKMMPKPKADPKKRALSHVSTQAIREKLREGAVKASIASATKLKKKMWKGSAAERMHDQVLANIANRAVKNEQLRRDE